MTCTTVVYQMADDAALIVVDHGSFSYNIYVTENADGTLNIIDKTAFRFDESKTYIHLEKCVHWLNGYVGPDRLANAQWIPA